MKTSERVVTRLPLVELWNDHGRVSATPVGPLGEADIVRLLHQGCGFVVADVGRHLQWVSIRERFSFWNTELQQHLVPPERERWYLEDFPGEYCYVATEWRLAAGSSVIVLERHH